MYLHNGNDRIGSTTLSIAYEYHTNARTLADGPSLRDFRTANLSALLIHSDNMGH